MNLTKFLLKQLVHGLIKYSKNIKTEDIDVNREEMTLLGFEIVAYAGDARSKLLEALKAAEMVISLRQIVL